MSRAGASAPDRCNAAPPTVSVIIPTYNAALHISHALDSVFAQTFSSYEVIVVNDASPDTIDLEGVLAPYWESIVYIKQENRGPGGARNTAIMESCAEYVAFLDSDDEWLPQYLAEQLRVLRQDSALDLVYSDALLFGDGPATGRTFMQNSPSGGAVSFESLLRGECQVITSCVVARRRALIDAGLFDERYSHAEDFDLWLRLAHRGGRMTYQRQVLARHRKSKGSLSSDLVKMARSATAILKKTLVTLQLSTEQRDLLTEQIDECEAFTDLEYGKQQLILGRYDEAGQALERANRYYRSHRVALLLFGLRIAPRLIQGVYRLRFRRRL